LHIFITLGVPQLKRHTLIAKFNTDPNNRQEQGQYIGHRKSDPKAHHPKQPRQYQKAGDQKYHLPRGSHYQRRNGLADSLKVKTDEDLKLHGEK
jgi:hypothetical protein